MNVDEKLVASIVQKVLSKVDMGSAEPNCAAAGGDWGVFATMNEAVGAAAPGPGKIGTSTFRASHARLSAGMLVSATMTWAFCR